MEPGAVGLRRATLGRTAVRVELRPHERIPAEGRAALRGELKALVEDLIGSLGLPLELDLEIEHAAAGSENGPRPPYEMTVDGQRCRIERHVHEAAASSAVPIARAIARDLYRNRELFVSRELCDRLHASWAAEPGGATRLPPGTFAALARQLAGFCLRIDRLKMLALTGEEAHDPALCRRAFERLLASSRNAIGLRLLAGDERLRALRERVPPGDLRSFEALLAWSARRAFAEKGVLVQAPDAAVGPRLRGTEFRVQVNDLAWPPFEGLADGEWLVMASEARVRETGASPAPATDPVTERACWRVVGDEALLERCRAVGETRGGAGVIAGSLLAFARRHASHLVTVSMIERQLEALRATEPALVDATASRFDPVVLTWILRDLLDGGVPVRDLRHVLEVLLDLEGAKASARALGDAGILYLDYWADWIRAGLRRQITFDRLGAGGTLDVYLLASEVETRIGSSEPLEETERALLLDALTEALAARSGGPLVVLTRQDLARRLRRSIEIELPRVEVLSYQDIGPEADVRPLGRIGGGG